MATYTNAIPLLVTSTGRLTTATSADTINQTGAWSLNGGLSTPPYSATTFNGTDFAGRIVLVDEFQQRACVAGDVANADANKNLCLVGLNSASVLSTFSANGGNLLTTAGGANDQMIVRSHTGANQSQWESTQWATASNVVFKATVVAGAAVTDVRYGAGLKITPTTLDNAFDNDQIWVGMDSAGALGGTAGEWVVVQSYGGTDAQIDTNVLVSIGQTYRIVIIIASTTRIVTVYINDVLVGTTAQPMATPVTTMKPFIGVQALGAAPRDLTACRLACSRTCGG